MRIVSKRLRSIAMAMMVITFGFGLCYGQVMPGQTAPLFSLEDITGRTLKLSEMKTHPMIILYFFDVESRPSQDGLLSLDNLAKRYKHADLLVWAITLSSKEKVEGFASRTKLSFPILLDKSGVSDLYQARVILPTICIVGPGLKVLDFFQGGGRSTEIMLVRLAERKLQQKQTTVAKAISEEALKKNPKNVKAKTVKGYAALKEGKLDESKTIFQDVSKDEGQGEVLGNEGLARVYEKEGQTEKALAAVKEVEQKAPDRAYVHTVKGDILYRQGKTQEAEKEYAQGIQKKDAEPYQRAIAHNQLGRLYLTQGKYERSRELFDQAVAIDPYYVEATSNKGRTYEKEGKWDKALEAYRQTLTLDKNDTFAAALARKAQEMLDLQKDIARKERIDKLVKELAERYRELGKGSRFSKPEETWTSRPMVLSFVDFEEKGGLAERDGLSAVLTTQLVEHLNASGRVQVVERILIEQLLQELNLGSSDLADKSTALRLGRVLASKLIGTGFLLNLPNGTLLSLRLIDSETSAIPKIVTRQIGTGQSLKQELHRLNWEILHAVMLKYPLRGYLVERTGDLVIINLGSEQGVVLGTRFEVLEEQKPIKYKGRLLQVSPKSVGQVEVTQVEPGLCYARVLDQKRPLKRDDKVEERIEDFEKQGGGDNVFR